jgi:hypothetical protein
MPAKQPLDPVSNNPFSHFLPNQVQTLMGVSSGPMITVLDPLVGICVHLIRLASFSVAG